MELKKSYEDFNSFCIAALVNKFKEKLLSQKERNEEELSALIEVELREALIYEEKDVQALRIFSAYLILFCEYETISFFGTNSQHALEEVVNVLDSICNLLSAFRLKSGDPTKLQEYSFFHDDNFLAFFQKDSESGGSEEGSEDSESEGSEVEGKILSKSLAAVTKGLKWILTFYLPIAARLILDKASEAAAASRRSASASQCHTKNEKDVIFLQWHSYLCGLMVSK